MSDSSTPNNDGEQMKFEIKEAEMYFIYSFMCNKAVNVDDTRSGGKKEYCEEFGATYGLYDRKDNKYSFAYKNRISRQIVLNMPYLHINDNIPPIVVNSNIKKFLSNNFPDISIFTFSGYVVKIYEDGRGIFRLGVDIPKSWTIEHIVHFMDIGSLPEVWEIVNSEIDKTIEKITGGLQRVEYEKKKDGDGVIPKEPGLIWQTPQILLSLNINKYNDFIKEDFEKRLKLIHYILNKSKGELKTVDTTFARYFTSILTNGGKFDVLNMCYDDQFYYTFSPEVCLFISNSGYDKKETIKWVEVRLLEVYESLRMRWYSLSIADELLDKAIQELSEVRSKIGRKKNIDDILREIKNFLEDWIDKKCIILRTFEDPSTQRCAGYSFNLLFKKGEECFLINELEDMVRFKLEHIDKVYTDIMDLARLESTNLYKPK